MGLHQGAHVKSSNRHKFAERQWERAHKSPSLQRANSHGLQPPYRFKFVYCLPSRFKTKQTLLAVHGESLRSAHQEIACEDGGNVWQKESETKIQNGLNPRSGLPSNSSQLIPAQKASAPPKLQPISDGFLTHCSKKNIHTDGAKKKNLIFVAFHSKAIYNNIMISKSLNAK